MNTENNFDDISAPKKMQQKKFKSVRDTQCALIC